MAQETLISPNITENQPLEREQIITYIRKWGNVNTDGLLDTSTQLFYIPEIEGFIGYKLKSSFAVVLGDPVCSQEDKPALALAFQTYCELKKIDVIYTMINQEFATWAVQHLEASCLEFGENFILDPQNDPAENTGPNAVLVRKKIKHAVKAGVMVKEYLNQELNSVIEQGINEVADEWLNKRNGPQVFLTHLNVFKDRLGKRYFYASQDNKIVGLVMLSALQQKNGWLMNNLMIAKGCASGLSELLVATALKIVAAEKCHHVVIGPLVGHTLGKIIGMSEINAACIRLTFKFLKFIFRLDGQRTFWSKFHYHVEGCYLAFPKKNLNLKSIRALLQAFHVG